MFGADAGEDLLDPHLRVALPGPVSRLPYPPEVAVPQGLGRDPDPLVEEPPGEALVGPDIVLIGQDVNERSVAVKENTRYLGGPAARHASASWSSQSRSAARQGNRAILR